MNTEPAECIVNAHYSVPGGQNLTVAELCVEVGMDGLVFEPNPGPALRGRWPTEATHMARRNVTDAICIQRTPDGLKVWVSGTLCMRTARFALHVAMRASHLARRHAAMAS